MPADQLEPPSFPLLVVGLGNPGPEYAGTRHNIGWRCLDAFAARLGCPVTHRRWSSLVGSGSLDHRQVWLMKPQTYMNASGVAVRRACRELGLEPPALWVVHDDMDLPLCRLRVRRGGSSAGHRGVESIIAALGTDAFVRFRVGVGKQPRPGPEAGRRHVLSGFSEAEAEVVPRVLEGVAEALELGVREGLERAMALYNRPGSLGCEELP